MGNASDLLLTAIKQNLETSILSWFIEKQDKIQKDDSAKSFYLTFGMIPRKTGNAPLQVDAALTGALEEIYPGFDSRYWLISELCRVSLMRGLNADQAKSWVKPLFNTADMHELVALYKGLFLLQDAADFTDQACEGIRTNMVPVFDAIALNNPFPARYLDENAWNQMVLKAIFMNRPIYRIFNIDDRNNPALGETLVDYVHERWSAGRNVVPELWRLTRQNLNAELFEELTAVFQNSEGVEKAAIGKFLMESNYQKARDWLKEQSTDFSSSTWDELGQMVENKN